MVDYVKSAATAKRLIEKNGRSVVLVRKSQTPADAAKPWRGPTSPGNTTVGTVKAAIFPIDEKDEIGGLIRRGDETAWIAHDSLATPEDLEDIDALVDGGVTYKVIKACPIGPGDVRIAYQFYVRR